MEACQIDYAKRESKLPAVRVVRRRQIWSEPRVSYKLVVTRVTTGALWAALNYSVEKLAVGVRSHVLTRIATGDEAGKVLNVEIV